MSKNIVIKLYSVDKVQITDEKGKSHEEEIHKLIKTSPPLDIESEPGIIGMFVRRNPEYAQPGTCIKSVEL